FDIRGRAELHSADYFLPIVVGKDCGGGILNRPVRWKVCVSDDTFSSATGLPNDGGMQPLVANLCYKCNYIGIE
ncbi:MAG: hypothetical protein II467_06925, partial [Bacilli bacterium]|nr:hypothetical protein [Bacilli bacterium]